MAKTISLACLHSGHAMTVNEDNLFLLDHYVAEEDRAQYEQSTASQDARQCFAVADGLGGEGLGDVAAQSVMQTLDKLLQVNRMNNRFDFVTFARDLVDQANRNINHLFQDYQGLQIGASFSMLLMEKDTAYTIGLGNSPIFLYRDMKLHRLTRDHTSQMSDRQQLTRYLGIPGQEGLSDQDNLTRTLLERGDILLLMTDGISKYLNEDQIRSVLMMPMAFVQQIRMLRDRVLEQGGEDNLSVIGIKILDPNSLAQPRTEAAKKNARQGTPGKKRPQNRTSQQKQNSAARNQPLTKKEKIWRVVKPIAFYLIFVLLGLLAGRLLFSMADWLG